MNSSKPIKNVRIPYVNAHLKKQMSAMGRNLTHIVSHMPALSVYIIPAIFFLVYITFSLENGIHNGV